MNTSILTLPPHHGSLFFAACLLAGLGARTASAAPADITSNFDSDREGWTVTGDFFPLVHFAVGGDEGGFIGYNDQAVGDSIDFIAPAKFTGDLSAYLGGTISYALRVTTSDPDFYSWTDLWIASPVGTLTLENQITRLDAPIGAWTSYDFVLGESQDWRFQATGSDIKLPAGDASIGLVLSNVTRFAIRGEFIDGDEFDALDSVRLAAPATAIPEPASVALLAGLTALFPTLARRRRP